MCVFVRGINAHEHVVIDLKHYDVTITIVVNLGRLGCFLGIFLTSQCEVLVTGLRRGQLVISHWIR